MEKTRIRRESVKVSELGQLYENSVKVMTVLFTIPTLMTIFKVIALDPARLTMQLEYAGPEQVGAWIVIAALTVYGTFKAVGYIISAGMAGWNGFRSPVEPALATVTLGLFWAVNFTGDVMGWGAFAIIAAMVTHTVSAALRSTPEPLD